MRTSIFSSLVTFAALTAFLATACGNEEAMPAPKEATKPPMTATAAAPPPPAPVTDIPVTSSNKEAVAMLRSGVDLLENSRDPEAVEMFKKALVLDPAFVSAKVLVGAGTPGSAGDALIADALGKATGLPEAELVNLQRIQAMHGRDSARSVELAKKVTDLLPASARAQGYYANALSDLGKIDEAKAAEKKAIELDPKYAPAYNMLGYLELGTGNNDAAVGHLQTYATLRPQEPNPQDSLGEAYLLVGKLDEADAAFKKALEIDPKFGVANMGSGFVSLYRGEGQKGIDQLAKFRDDPANTIADRSDTFAMMAWSQLALNKPADAMKTLDAWDADTKKANDAEQGLIAAMNRAHLTLEAGKPEDAAKQITALLDRVSKTTASDGRKARWSIRLRAGESVAYARLKKAPEAEKAKTAIDTLASGIDSADVKTMVTIAHGEALLAKGDASGAAKELAACAPTFDYCLWEKLKAEEKAGLKTEAAATRQGLVKNRRRNGMSFFVWSKVAPPAAPVAAKAALTPAAVPAAKK